MKSKAPLLLVDDDAPFVDSMKRRLENLNFTVEIAFSGDEALEKLEDNSNIEVVIMDVSMPGMDGITTLGRIRDLHPSVEVIMLTGYDMVECAIEGIQLGAFDYLMKPCNMQKLLAAVEQARLWRGSGRSKE